MITISGRNIQRDNHLAPSLYDIGYHCSKQPRFGGATTGHWTVLHHLFAAMLYAYDWRPKQPQLHLYAALHDAHESITSDVPQPWKTDDLRALQQDLDRRIYAMLKIPGPDLMTERMVKTIDNQLVYNEAQVYAPQVAAAILVPGPNYRDSINQLDTRGPKAVKEAELYLARARYDAKKCGQLYEQLITNILKRIEEDDHKGASTGAAGVGQADGLERSAGRSDADSPNAQRAVGSVGGVSKR